LREKVAPKGSDEGLKTLKAATTLNRRNLKDRCDPSSVGFADTFSRKGRRAS